MKSIKTKIVALICCLVILSCSMIGILSYVVSANAVTKEIGEELHRLAVLGSGKVESELDIQWNILETLADSNNVQNWDTNWDEASKTLSKEIKRDGCQDIAIVDAAGNTKSPSGAVSNIKDTELFTKVISGEKVVSDPSISKLDNKSIVMAFAVPIKKNNEIVGAVMMVRDGEYLSKITDTVTFAKNSTAFMINNKGTSVANPIIKNVYQQDNIFQDYKKDSGLKQLVAVQEKMIKGESGYGEFTYQKVTKLTGYTKVEGTNWSIAIAAPKHQILRCLNSVKITGLIIGFIIMLFSIILGIISSHFIVKPIKIISNHIKQIASGDFSIDVPASITKRKDEIGTLAISTDTMQLSIKNMIKGVLIEAKSVADLAEIEEKNMSGLSDKVTEVSAVTEELSAGLEETAASVEEMTATEAEIETAINSIAQKASEGLSKANEISQRALTLKENAIVSQKTANEIYIDAETSLKNAIDQSKAVDQINILSDAILQIATQTNLLALNASIEAARAGEAGKGFAVVAEEIRKLAENSTDTVNEIQKVTQIVLESVQNLSDSSLKILHFINTQVMTDYNTLVQTGEQYNNDAVVVNDMVTELSAISEEMAASMENITKAINEIAMSSNEGAQGTQQIAGKSGNIAIDAKEVLDCSRKINDSTENLVNMTLKFKINNN